MGTTNARRVYGEGPCYSTSGRSEGFVVAKNPTRQEFIQSERHIVFCLSSIVFTILFFITNVFGKHLLHPMLQASYGGSCMEKFRPRTTLNRRTYRFKGMIIDVFSI